MKKKGWENRRGDAHIYLCAAYVLVFLISICWRRCVCTMQ